MQVKFYPTQKVPTDFNYEPIFLADWYEKFQIDKNRTSAVEGIKKLIEQDALD